MPTYVGENDRRTLERFCAMPKTSLRPKALSLTPFGKVRLNCANQTTPPTEVLFEPLDFLLASLPSPAAQTKPNSIPCVYAPHTRYNAANKMLVPNPLP
jgi:hypothetical protein